MGDEYLLSCPFCGSEAEVRSHMGWSYGDAEVMVRINDHTKKTIHDVEFDLGTEDNYPTVTII